MLHCQDYEFLRWKPYFFEMALYGRNRKNPMFLIGHSPTDELSYIFMKPERNTFLVKGYVHEGLTLYREKTTVFFVEEWYLIEPIKRDYGQADYRQQEQRFFTQEVI